MFAKLLQATTLTAIALFLKRLFVRGKYRLPYRTPGSRWPSRSYREPS